jgi:NADH dehydrogenase
MKTHPIVIVGGGFGGLRAALDLDKRLGHHLNAPIFLIDPSPYHIYTPTLYDVVSSEVPRVVAIPYTEILEGTNIRYLQERVTHIDLDIKQVVTERRRLKYDDLVLALGSQAHPLEKKQDELAEVLTCKTLDDVLKIRQQIESCFEQVKGVKGNMCHNHIIVAGSGPTGVEFAAGLNNYIKLVAQKHGLSPKGVHITLVEAADRILPKLSPKMSELVHKYLRQQGVSIATKTKLSWKGHKQLKLGDDVLPLTTTIWAVGVRPHKLLHQIKGLRHDEHDRVLVDGSLQAVDMPRVWVLGDAASVIDSGVAESATAHGRHIAAAIERVRNDDVAPGYCPNDVTVVLPLSKEYGVAWYGSVIREGRNVILAKRLDALHYFRSILPFGTALQYWLSRGEVVKEGEKLCYKPGTPKRA